MSRAALKIHKKLQEITLWVHPTGPVIGSVFLAHPGDEHPKSEDPIELLNHEYPFLVIQCGDPHEVRFYNKRSIVRAYYSGQTISESASTLSLPCRLHMMDGSLIEGLIKESLPPESSRLFDYLNMMDAKFIKLHVSETDMCLVNKSYIVRVAPLTAGASPSP